MDARDVPFPSEDGTHLGHAENPFLKASKPGILRCKSCAGNHVAGLRPQLRFPVPCHAHAGFTEPGVNGHLAEDCRHGMIAG